jgi:hypothetical protein
MANTNALFDDEIGVTYHVELRAAFLRLVARFGLKYGTSVLVVLFLALLSQTHHLDINMDTPSAVVANACQQHQSTDRTGYIHKLLDFATKWKTGGFDE